MAEYGEEKESDDEEIRETLSLMRKRMQQAIAAYSDSREDELNDLKFKAGSPDNNWQWPADVLATRGSVQGQTINARPCLTINKLPQHVLQVTNDQRQNRPAGKVIPVDDKADIEVAKILDGIVRHIEYISDADVAYDTACDAQVTFGEGYFRILTDYVDENSFDQDIRIARIRNAFSVSMDPLMQDPCGSDAEWAIINTEISKEEYDLNYPDFKPLSSIEAQGIGDDSLAVWIGKDTVRIAEYFYVEHEQKTLNQYPDGTTALSDSPEAKQAKQYGLKPSKTRKVDVKKICWIKTNGFEILDKKDWAGKWIPIIRVVGNEYEVEGRLYLSGLIRNAKDAQRMYNYWVSQEAEMLALAPKAPFIGYGGQFEGYEAQWKTANINNWPYLETNPDATDGMGNPLPLPERAMPPQASSGILQAKAGAADDIKSATGQYDASLGVQGNEKSGKAILARERQSDVGTYHYVDNLARAVRHCTRQLIDLIPKIYDTQRVARIIGIDGETDNVEVNPQQQQGVVKVQDENGATIKKIYNLGIGTYDVAVTTGPSYMTKRQESLEAMAQLLQGNQQLWAVAGDLFIKNMDWPGADEMAERFRKTLDPKLLSDDEAAPEVVALQQQLQQMSQELDQTHEMLKQADVSIEAKEMQNKHYETDIKAYQAETQRLQMLSSFQTEQPPNIKQEILAAMQELLAGSATMEQEEPAQLEQGEQEGMQQ
ncbi:MAG: portal protein [Sulfurimonas sp.]|jgi:hypothetical protein